MLRCYLVPSVVIAGLLALVQPAGAGPKEAIPRPNAVEKDAPSDSVFFRRLHLDFFGLPPLPEDLRKFIEDDAPDKRSKAIDRLLESPEFGKHWHDHWSKVIDEEFRDSEASRKRWTEFWKKLKK